MEGKGESCELMEYAEVNDGHQICFWYHVKSNGVSPLLKKENAGKLEIFIVKKLNFTKWRIHLYTHHELNLWAN